MTVLPCPPPPYVLAVVSLLLVCHHGNRLCYYSCGYALPSTMDRVLSEAICLKHFSHKLSLNTKGVRYFGHLRRCRWCLQASPKCVIDTSGLLVLKEMGVQGGSPKSQALIHPLSVPTSMPLDVTRKKNGTEPTKRRELSSQKRKDFLRSPAPPPFLLLSMEGASSSKQTLHS